MYFKKGFRVVKPKVNKPKYSVKRKKTKKFVKSGKVKSHPHMALAKNHCTSLLRFAFMAYLLTNSDTPGRELINQLSNLEIESAMGFKDLLKKNREEMKRLMAQERSIKNKRNIFKLRLINKAAQKTIRRKIPSGLLTQIASYA